MNFNSVSKLYFIQFHFYKRWYDNCLWQRLIYKLIMLFLSLIQYMKVSERPSDLDIPLPLWRKLCFAVGGAPYQITGTVIGFFLNIFLLEVALVCTFIKPKFCILHCEHSLMMTVSCQKEEDALKLDLCLCVKCRTYLAQYFI